MTATNAADLVSLHYISSIDTVTTLERRNYALFLKKYLDDADEPLEHLLRAVDYAVSKYPHQGGFLLAARLDGQTVGVCVMNYTHMSGYLPENVLVYLVVHRDHRRQGVGRKLIKKALQMAKGEVAVRITADNPARAVFERYGFTRGYLELRRPN
ncbi:MAG: GNAT family N-acetyltransferase [Catalinimonas sp.]